MKYTVIGLGRFGMQLARALAQAGFEVIAIDKDRKLVEEISVDVSVAVRLDSTDEEALRAQGVDKVDVAIVGIGQAFQANILTAMLVKSFGVPHIYCRAEQETQGEILRRLGASDVIFPEYESAQRWAFKLMAPQITEKLEFAEGYSLAQYTAPESFHGKNLSELNLRQKYRINLIGLRRADSETEKQQAKKIINVPLPETVVYQNDTLWLVGSDQDLTSLPTK